jgi:hypothetical protein
MKYKNIELKSGNDSEAELLCNVTYKNEDCDDDIVEEMEDTLFSLFENYKNEVVIETVTDELTQVRCWDITFDKKGIQILKGIYDKLLEAKLDAIISIGIHVDEEWFKEEDGHEYNEDDVTYEEFLKHIEY